MKRWTESSVQKRTVGLCRRENVAVLSGRDLVGVPRAVETAAESGRKSRAAGASFSSLLSTLA
jgi:hypothetical protein